MDTPTADTSIVYRRIFDFSLAWAGLLVILFGLNAPSFCFEDADCKFFKSALFNYHYFEVGWREGLVGNTTALQIVAVLSSVVVAIRLRDRSAMLMGVLAGFVIIGLVYQSTAYTVSEFSQLEWLEADLRIGWWIIAFGCLLLGIAVAKPRVIDEPEYPPKVFYRWPNNTQVILAVLGLILFASGAIIPLYCVSGVSCKIHGAGSLFRAEDFDEGLRPGLATTWTGITVFGLAFIVCLSLVVPGNRRNPRNYALIIATVAAVTWLIVTFVLVILNLNLLDRESRLQWGWLPFWAGALLLIFAADQKANPQPIPPVALNDSIAPETSPTPDEANSGDESNSEPLSDIPVQD